MSRTAKTKRKARPRWPEQVEMMRARGYITAVELARLAGISASAVRQLCKSGRLRSLTVGTHRYIETTSALEYLGPVAGIGLRAKRGAR